MWVDTRDRKAYFLEYARKNKTRKNALQRARYKKNREHILKTKLAYRQRHPDRIKKLLANNYLKFKDQHNARNMKRLTRKLNALPAWVKEPELWLIKEFYHLAKLRTKATGFRWSVDHIIPLQGKLVCGLHVPTNLQVIPGKLNSQKHNSFEVL